MTNATYRPSAEIDGSVLSPFAAASPASATAAYRNLGGAGGGFPRVMSTVWLPVRSRT